MVNPVRKSSRFISTHSHHVRVNPKGCYKMAEWLYSEWKVFFFILFKYFFLCNIYDVTCCQNGKITNIVEPTDSFEKVVKSLSEDDMANYVFFNDILNFSFYYDDGSSYYVEYPEKSGKIYQVNIFISFILKIFK